MNGGRSQRPGENASAQAHSGRPKKFKREKDNSGPKTHKHRQSRRERDSNDSVHSLIEKLAPPAPLRTKSHRCAASLSCQANARYPAQSTRSRTAWSTSGTCAASPRVEVTPWRPFAEIEVSFAGMTTRTRPRRRTWVLLEYGKGLRAALPRRGRQGETLATAWRRHTLWWWVRHDTLAKHAVADGALRLWQRVQPLSAARSSLPVHDLACPLRLPRVLRRLVALSERRCVARLVRAEQVAAHGAQAEGEGRAAAAAALCDLLAPASHAFGGVDLIRRAKVGLAPGAEGSEGGGEGGREGAARGWGGCLYPFRQLCCLLERSLGGISASLPRPPGCARDSS